MFLSYSKKDEKTPYPNADAQGKSQSRVVKEVKMPCPDMLAWLYIPPQYLVLLKLSSSPLATPAVTQLASLSRPAPSRPLLPGRCSCCRGHSLA